MYCRGNQPNETWAHIPWGGSVLCKRTVEAGELKQDSVVLSNFRPEVV